MGRKDFDFCHEDRADSERESLVSRRRLLRDAVLGVGLVAATRSGLQRASEQLSGMSLAAGYAGPQEDTNGYVQAFEGTLESLSPHELVVDVGGSSRSVPVHPSSTFWKGPGGAAGDFQQGDDVLVRVVDDRLDQAWANLDVVKGIIKEPTPRGFVVANDAIEREIVVWGRANYEDARTGQFSGPRSLPNGAWVQLSGLSVPGSPGSGQVIATAVRFDSAPQEHSNPSQAEGPTLEQVGPLALCVYSWNGIASIYTCPTGAGRCGTCNTNNDAQLAWPAMDSGCGGCPNSCCNCSKNCKNQAYLSCGSTVTVLTACYSKQRDLRVVDCGPCQRCDANCVTCVCNHQSSCNGITRKGTIVDLTRPTFSTFHNPDVRTSFPCTAKTSLPC